MTANELLAETHPGRTILEDVVKPLGMSVNAFAKELHVPATRLEMTLCAAGEASRRTPRSGWVATWAPQRSFGSISSPPMNCGLLNDGKDRRSRRPLTLEGPSDPESANPQPLLRRANPRLLPLRNGLYHAGLITEEEFARQLGISQSQLSKYERD